MCDVLHRVSQSQKDLALLWRFRNHSSRSNCAKINSYCKHLHLLQLMNTFKNCITSSQWMDSDHAPSIRKAPMPCKTLNIRNTYFWNLAEISIPHLLFFRHGRVFVMHSNILLQGQVHAVGTPLNPAPSKHSEQSPQGTTSTPCHLPERSHIQAPGYVSA